MSQNLARLIAAEVGNPFQLGDLTVTRSMGRIDSTGVFAFRFREYVDAGFITPDSFPTGQLCDEFDEVAIQIVVKNSTNEIVGATRFVPSTPIGFQTESLFAIDTSDLVNRCRIGEFGRLVVARRHRGGERLATLGLLKGVFESMRERGTTHVLAFLALELADSFARLGCKYSILRERALPEIAARSRSAMRMYFDRQQPSPVVFILDEMLRDVGVRC